jgi:hypothetical protein
MKYEGKVYARINNRYIECTQKMDANKKAKELKDNPIQEISEIGWPASIIYREGEPVGELIKTVDLIEEIFYGYAIFLNS